MFISMESYRKNVMESHFRTVLCMIFTMGWKRNFYKSYPLTPAVLMARLKKKMGWTEVERKSVTRTHRYNEGFSAVFLPSDSQSAAEEEEADIAPR